MSEDSFRFTLLGTGSSGGVPRIGGDWGVCDPAEPRNRRTRCSAMVERIGKRGTTRVLIDTAPDMREQLLAHNVGEVDAVMFSHDHADQTHGIDDLRVLAMRKHGRVPVYMDAATASTLQPKFAYCFEGRGGYPAILQDQARLEPLKPVTIKGKGGAITLLPLDQNHGRIQSLGFRIGTLAYCNDVKELPPETLANLGGLEVFVADALRYKSHPTHAHLKQVLKWVDALEPAQTLLTNLHIDMDYQTLSRELPAHIQPGYDGCIVTFNGSTNALP